MRLSNTMNTILSEGKGSDFTLKAGEHEFSAHKIILESRSEYFSKMLQQDMEETRTGVVNIKNIHPDAIKAVLSFIYSARADSLTYDNVFQIYEVADQYDLKELKGLCKVFMLENLCDEHICDIIKLSDIYNDEELGRVSREYFNENIKKIVKTGFWKVFYTENQEFAMNLIADTIDKRL